MSRCMPLQLRDQLIVQVAQMQISSHGGTSEMTIQIISEAQLHTNSRSATTRRASAGVAFQAGAIADEGEIPAGSAGIALISLQPRFRCATRPCFAFLGARIRRLRNQQSDFCDIGFNVDLGGACGLGLGNRFCGLYCRPARLQAG